MPCNWCLFSADYVARRDAVPSACDTALRKNGRHWWNQMTPDHACLRQHRASLSNTLRHSLRMHAVSPPAEDLCRWLSALSQSFVLVRLRRAYASSNDKSLHAVEPLHQLFFWYTRLCLLEIIFSFRISRFTRHQRAFSIRLLPQLIRYCHCSVQAGDKIFPDLLLIRPPPALPTSLKTVAHFLPTFCSFVFLW